MEIDNDLDAQLLMQFSSLGTTDKEVLIAEFQKLLDNQMTPEASAFFLDMTNWNLQAAICAYYDLEQPAYRIPSMALVRDTTVGEGESVPPTTRFVKTWKIQNTGTDDWPTGCFLKFVSGEHLGHVNQVMVSPLTPGQIVDISVDMCSPTTLGIHQGQWRMSTPNGLYFGEAIWVIVQVEESGLLGVTQLMSRFGSELSPSNHGPSSHEHNPFTHLVRKPGNISPTSSIIAHQGSLPSSPQLDPLPESFNHHHSSIRTALFQNSPGDETSSAQQDMESMDS